jgi:phthalate 4,5-dioxygenase
MLSKEENQLLTRVGPGTPMGELIRRYWQPAALAEELPVGGAPIPVRLLGEDLVLFRDESGQPGLLGIHCSHRGADLSYGRIEDGGLRCLYHGWLFDRRGRCLEQPGEPAGSTFYERIKHPAYPCQERGGIIFTYMGPGQPPLLPEYEFLMALADRQFVTKIFEECNFLQGNEGNIDPQHLSFLHRVARDEHGLEPLTAKDMAPTLETEETDFGVRIFAVRRVADDQHYVRITNFIMPNLSAFGGDGNGGYSVNWHVPIDDTHHWKYTAIFRRDQPLDPETTRRGRATTTPDYHLLKNARNRYGQDREQMKTDTFTGMGRVFQVHDAYAVETQGPVQDRTAEHLGYTDKAITAARKMLLHAVRELQDGREPPHVIRDQAEAHVPNLVVRADVIARDLDWRTYWKEGRDERTLVGAR